MITELDFNKYFVLKQDDIGKLSLEDIELLGNISDEIVDIREKEGKKQNEYVVLNLGDSIDVIFLMGVFTTAYNKWRNTPDFARLKVRDIAVDLVNAVLIAKEQGVDK